MPRWCSNGSAATAAISTSSCGSSSSPKRISPPRRTRRSRVQQAVDKCPQRRLGMMSVRVVEEQASRVRRPVRQHPLQPALRNRIRNALVVIGVENPETLKRSLERNLRMIGYQRSVDADLKRFAVFFELPAMDIAAPGKAPINATMAVQVGGRLRFATALQIGR